MTLPSALPALSFLARARDEHQRTAGRRHFATVLFARCRLPTVVMPRALDFLTNFNDDLFQVQIRASYYFACHLTMLATGSPFDADLHPGLVRLSASAAVRRNRGGNAAMLVFAILLPTVDPVSLR